MPLTLSYFIIDTDMGWVGMLSGPKGLLATTLPQGSAEEACLQLGSRAKGAELSQEAFGGLAPRLRNYFRGDRIDFSEKLDLSGMTAFQGRVYRACRLIQYGETRSYGWVAEQMKKPGAARAVGQALGRNPLPVIVPCHRVVAGNGGLGGFTGGLETKGELLNMESGSAGFQG